MNSFEYKKLADLTFRIKVGFVGSINDFYCKPENGIPIIRTTDIDSIDFDKLNYVTNEFHVKNKKSQLKKGDLIIARHGENGNAVIYEHERCAQVLNAVIIEPDPKKMSSELLKIFFDSPFIKKQISGSVKGSVQDVINTKHISDLLLNIDNNINYDFVTKAITNFSRKIALNNKINTELEAMAKLIYDYWFLQFDFPDTNGKPYKSSGGKMVYNEALKREIPDGWNVGKLGDIIKLNYGKPLKKECRSGQGFPVVGSGGIVGFHDIALVKGPGIVVGRKGTVGSITYLDNDFHPIDTSYFVGLKLKVSFSYISLLLKTLGLSTMNSDSAVPGLNRDRALDVNVLLAPINLIETFCVILDSMFIKMANCRRQNQKLSELRDWLLPMLMNGQVTVKDV
ncbi:MAG: restriction endonuclease subunit S [Tatlockia sp.]|nr:restriction endonuclease subunit S [Tatlockia sp.]